MNENYIELNSTIALAQKPKLNKLIHHILDYLDSKVCCRCQIYIYMIYIIYRGVAGINLTVLNISNSGAFL